jgi:hypothetical protein
LPELREVDHVIGRHRGTLAVPIWRRAREAW